MPEQHLLLREPSPARVTPVRSLARVSAQVTSERAARGQPLAARVTPRARTEGNHYTSMRDTGDKLLSEKIISIASTT